MSNVPCVSTGQVDWTGSGTSGGECLFDTIDVPGTGRAIPSGQRIWMANLDMSD